MDAHFRGFSFVDRITSIHEGRRIRGSYALSANAGDFPLALVGEAVGQLAAWAAMAAVRFDHRPVAGLAGRVELLQAPRAGQVLELEANLEHVDADSVEYHGTAHVDGRPVIHLRDCVGPMMPLADFDDPRSVAERYEQLCHGGAEPGTFPGLPPLLLARTDGDLGRRASAVFQVPSEAPFFGDHFPRRPVFPGSLLMHLNLELGAALANELTAPPGVRWMPDTLLDMKLRSFVPPGATLQLEATCKQQTRDSARIGLETRLRGEMVATASLALMAGEAP
jgi:3-hydroxymyristoyl/3-hydroxydecanoyl-(acyl carrier protein) dehydratase